MSPLGGASRRSTHDILLAVSGRPGGKPLVSSSTQIKQNSLVSNASKMLQSLNRVGALKNVNASVRNLAHDIERMVHKEQSATCLTGVSS